MPTLDTANPLAGRKLWIHPMTYAGAKMLAYGFASIGVDAEVTPPGDSATLELGGKYTSGEECLPEKVTLGDYLKVTTKEGFDPKKTAFILPTANGPCRFGQYRQLMQKVFRELGYQDALVFSPTSEDGYNGFGEHGGTFRRTAWRALVIGDLLTKALLKTRPYELRRGDTDEVFEWSIVRMGQMVAQPYDGAGKQMERLVRGLEICHEEYETIPADYSEPKLLIGIVGEIFCRLNDFSNDSLIRKLEEFGCEAWISDVAEWVWHVNNEEVLNLKDEGKRFYHPDRITAWIKHTFQKQDEHHLYEAFGDYFVGYEEAEDINEILGYSHPYLPPEGCLGEMVLSTGKSVYLHRKGADGVVDISPFTCMNGIITEAIYPRVIADCDGMPIRMFYFDGISSDLDRDVGIFVELAKTYSNRKKHPRPLPRQFQQDLAVA